MHCTSRSRRSDDPNAPVAELKPVHRRQITVALSEHAFEEKRNAVLGMLFSLIGVYVVFRIIGPTIEDWTRDALHHAVEWLWATKQSGELSTA